MEKLSVFDGINNDDLKLMLNCFDAKNITFNKGRTIASYLNSTNLVGVVISGEANLLRYDYDGKRTIIEHLVKNDIFGELFTNISNAELSVVAATNCEVLFFDYDCITKRCKKSCPFHAKLIDNILSILSNKVQEVNERIDIITKKTTRDKLLAYFEKQAKLNLSKTFELMFTYTDLADYLSVDRSSMMREIKSLKNDGFIKDINKKITILY